jgi:hypothetical protein
VRGLYLIRVNVTDRGPRHLEARTGLKDLYLLDCPNVTREVVTRLRKALPGCTINR